MEITSGVQSLPEKILKKRAVEPEEASWKDSGERRSRTSCRSSVKQIFNGGLHGLGPKMNSLFYLRKTTLRVLRNLVLPSPAACACPQTFFSLRERGDTFQVKYELFRGCFDSKKHRPCTSFSNASFAHFPVPLLPLQLTLQLSMFMFPMKEISSRTTKVFTS